MSNDPLGLFSQQDPLGLFETNEGAQAPSIPGAERYDATQKKRKIAEESRTPEQRTKDGLKSWGEVGLGALEAGYGLAHNISAYLTSIPVTATTIAGKRVAPKDWSKEFFDNVQAMSYVPKTGSGEKLTQKFGEALQPFGLSPYIQAGPMSARASAVLGKRAPKETPKSIDQTLADIRKEAEATVPKMDEAVINVPEFRLESPIAADTRVREMNMKMPSADDYNNRDANVRAVEEEIQAYEQARAFDEQQAQLEALQKSVDDLAKLNELNPDGSYKTQTLIDDTPYGERPAQFGFTDTGGRIDENGIPIRADLSMDAQNVQDPLQMNLWGDELPGRTGDGGLPLTRALDKMEPGAARAQAIEQLTGQKGQPLESQVQDILNKGVSRGQRGALNMDIFDPFFQRVKDLPNGIRLVFQGDTESPVVHAYKNERPVGILKLESDKWVAPSENDNLRAQWVDTSNAPVANLAPEMYKFVSEVGNDIVPSKTQTPDGKAMWQRFEQRGISQGGMIRGQRGGIDLEALGFKPKGEVDKLIKSLMDKKLFAEIPKALDVIAEAMEHGKDSFQSILFSAGSTLQAMKTNSPLIRGVSRIIQGHKNMAENMVRESVFPVEESFRKLSSKEFQDVAAVLKDMMFNGALTPEQLLRTGLNEKQLLAIQKLRDMQKAAYEAQNQERIAAGKQPITELEAYMSSRWHGDFRIPLYDAKGNLQWYIAADNKWAANKQAGAVAKQFGLNKGGMSIVKSSRKGGDQVRNLYTAMLDVAGRDNPMVQEIKTWLETSTSKEAEAARGQLKHFEPKSNTRGFAGDRPYNNPRQEALDLIQSQVDYAKNAHYWAQMQQAGAEIKKILADENINATQPKNMEYVREYWLDQIGFNEAKVIKALEDTFRGLGVSPNQIGRGIGNIKNFWTTQKLAGNLGFMASNVMQFGAMLPHLMDISVKQGGNPITSLINGTITGMMMASGHKMKKNEMFYRMVASTPGDNTFLLNAMKFAEDNSVIARSIFDENPLSSSFSPYSKVMNTLGKTISIPETYLRSTVYMTYANMLKSTGKYTDDLELFRDAEERTNASMGDYREGERALVFSKLGQIGNAANTLQTFPMNYYNQWSWVSREAGRGNVAPMLGMIAVQGYLAGTMGLPLFAELDRGWELMKDWLAKEYPLQWAKIKDFSFKELALNAGGEDLLYGSASTDTGLALTSRAQAPVPSEMMQTPFAPAIDFAKMVGNVGSLAMDPMDRQKQAQAAFSVAPTGIHGWMETGPFKDVVANEPREDGTTIYKKTKDLSKREGSFARTPEDERVRATGLRTQREQVTKDLDYLTGRRASQTQGVLRDLPDRIHNSIRSENMKRTKDLIDLYKNLGGDPKTLLTAYEREMEKELMTPTERSISRKNLPIEATKQYKRLQELLTEMGYK